MESILNPAYPHIFEKIFLCLNRDSILNFRLLNHHWKNTLENVFTKDLAKLMLLRKFKELADIISIITYRYILQKLGKIWLNLIQFLNQENLWSRDVTENMFLCINRICCLIERRKCKPDYYCTTVFSVLVAAGTIFLCVKKPSIIGLVRLLFQVRLLLDLKKWIYMQWKFFQTESLHYCKAARCFV